MLRFYYNPKYKYTNRQIIDLSNDRSFVDIDYINIDSPDTINGHIIYEVQEGENIPTYVEDLENKRKYYVSGITQLRTGKYQISLLRDIISEGTEWKYEQAYITAGHANDYNKYKKWGLPFTNTKVSEQRLNINGASSFFVYYVNTQEISGKVLSETDLTISSSSIPGITGYDYEVTNLNEIPNFDLVGSGEVSYYNPKSSGLYIKAVGRFTPVAPILETYEYLYGFDTKQLSTNKENRSDSTSINLSNNAHTAIINNENNIKNQIASILRDVPTLYYGSKPNVINISKIQEIDKYVNKIIYDRSSSKVYKIIKKTTSNQYKKFNIAEQSLLDQLVGKLRGVNWPAPSVSYEQKGNWATITSEETTANYTLEELGTATGFDFNFTKDARKLPKSAVRCVNIVPTQEASKEAIAQCLMLAQTNGINEKGDTGRILDIQYLPFSVATKTNDKIKINSKPLIAQFLDTDDYEYRIDLPDLVDINKETDTIKIVSPSRANQFVFSPYNNGGSMIFDTKITLKPNTSIIYVRPSTQGLLMADWNDKDCLVIQEDFSLTNVSSNWTNYIYNNRNYQNTFNRDIQGREFGRQWERRIESAQARADEWTSRNISSQKAQTYTGNLPLISGMAGAIGTAFKDENYMQAARLDREYNEAMYQESLSLAKDNFKMQLENIQSQPNIPTSITTIDVKLLDGVYLEFYSTNPTEKQAIRDFYRYNGDRIDAYGTFSAYYGWFVRGKIIIANNYTQPEFDELNRRLQAGIFTEVQYYD